MRKPPFLYLAAKIFERATKQSEAKAWEEKFAFFESSPFQMAWHDYLHSTTFKILLTQ